MELTALFHLNSIESETPLMLLPLSLNALAASDELCAAAALMFTTALFHRSSIESETDAHDWPTFWLAFAELTLNASVDAAALSPDAARESRLV